MTTATLGPVAVLMPVEGESPRRSSERVRRQRRSARRALEIACKLAGIVPLPWRRDDEGRPLPTNGIYWSISHKTHYAAAVVAASPVGIDIEAVVPRPRELWDMVAADAEWSLLGGRDWDAFFRLWTAKEATLKANGDGIGRLLECSITHTMDPCRLKLAYGGTEWMVEQIAHDGHRVAVASRRTAVEWHVGVQRPSGGTSQSRSIERWTGSSSS